MDWKRFGLDRIRFEKRWLYVLVLLAVPALVLVRVPRGSKKEGVVTPASNVPRAESRVGPLGKNRPWSLDEAKATLRKYRDSDYFQYVVLQLATAEKRLQVVLEEFPELKSRRADARPLFWPGDGVAIVQQTRTDAFQISVEQKHSAEPMVSSGSEDANKAGAVPKAGVAGKQDLVAPESSPRDWLKAVATMSSGGSGSATATSSASTSAAPVSELSKSAPADFWFAEFPSFAKLVATTELLQRSLLGYASLDQRSLRPFVDRLCLQLLVDRSAGSVDFHGLVVQQVAVMGSDPFFTEGTDVSLVFRLKQPTFFQDRWLKDIEESVRRNSGAQRVRTKIAGVDVDGVNHPAGVVRVFGCSPSPQLHIRSNSLAALRRILEAHAAKPAKTGDAVRLADANDYRVFRSQFVGEEDGFVFFSEAFFRQVFSPKTQEAQAMRLRGLAHLRMLNHAALLYRTQQGRAPASLDELAKAGCTPGEFNAGRLVSPAGGKYSFDVEAVSARCSVLGSAEFLTPCYDLELSAARETSPKAPTPNRAIQQSGVLAPLALRVRQAGPRVTVEMLTGSAVSPTDTKTSSASISLTLTPEPKSPFVTTQAIRPESLFNDSKTVRFFGSLGLDQKQTQSFLNAGLAPQVSIYFKEAPAAATQPAWWTRLVASGSTSLGEGWLVGESLSEGVSRLLHDKAPVAIGFPIVDSKVADEAIARINAHVGESSLDAFQISVTNGTMINGVRLFTDRSIARIFWARVGNALFLANNVATFEELLKAPKTNASQLDHTGGHVRVQMKLPAWAEDTESQLMRAEQNRLTCLRNLALLTGAGRGLGMTPPVSTKAATADERRQMIRDLAERSLGDICRCPDAGRYQLVLGGDSVAFTCSMHGSLSSPMQKESPSDAGLAARFFREWSDVGARSQTTGPFVRTTFTFDRR